jgi:solute:Na+ symporter, SSS family
MNTLDITIIVASLVCVVAVGLLAGRKQDKTAKSYFLASGRLPWFVIGTAFVSTSVSSEQIVGTVGAAFKNGMGVANWEWWSMPVYALFILFFAPLFLKTRITTIPDYYARRFGPLCADIYSWIMLLAYVFVFMVPVLYGGSLAFSQLTGWNFYLVLWLTVVLVAGYTAKGGLASVMWTDALQCIMLLGGGLTLYFIALANTPGGWSEMVRANPERFHLYHSPTDPIAPFPAIVLATFGLYIFYSAGNQVMVQRVLAARSTWDGLMGVIFAGFINLLRPLVTCFLGLIVYYWIVEMHKPIPEGMTSPLQNPDTTFPFALQTLSPEWGLRGIILAGFLAAVMSATSALSNSVATIFSFDVYKKLINRDAPDRQIIFIGRLAAVGALCIAAIVAPSVGLLGGIFKYFQTGVSYLATPFISILWMGILWRRTNNPGALFGLIGGTLIQAAVVLAAYLADANLHWLYLASIAQVITMLGIAVVSLCTPAMPAERTEPMVWTLSALTQFDDGRRRPWYQSLRLWFGIFAVVWVCLYWRFW